VQAPQQPEGPNKKGRAAGGIGAVAATLAALVAKFAAVAKIFAVSWTFILSLSLYAIAFGWRFGVLIVLLILAHELGHYAAFRAYGLPVRLPVFVPFLGAFTAGAVPQDPEHAAYIALAGPLVGLGLSAACYALGASSHERFWLAASATGAFLNLFNMIPVPPFDGGRVVLSARTIQSSARYIVYAWYAAVVIGLIFVTWQSYSVLGPTNAPY
jgi:Zn-dependent protease